MIQKEKIAFIINPVSGTKSKKSLPEIINSLLDTKRFEPTLHYTEHLGHATELADKLAEDGVPYIVAVGGDGTVNEVGKALIHTQSALGIIPFGSGNGLARHLKIPLNTRKAVEALNTASVLAIDYGKANDNIFFCTCGVGFDAHVSQQFALAGKRGIKTYVEKSVVEYFNYSPQHYHLKNEEIDVSQDALLITFANASQYGNNAYIAPHADLQDGMMDVCILSKFPLIRIPGLAMQLFSKKIYKSHYMFSMKTDKITLMRDNAGAFHFDGEASETGQKVEVKIIPKGLKIFVK